MYLRDYTFLGMTRSLCPTCRRLVDAKIIVRNNRVYLRKNCPEHGTFDDFVCSDVSYYDRHEFDQPARLPRVFGTLPDKGCPYDCGLCTDHEQHSCLSLVEVTDSSGFGLFNDNMATARPTHTSSRRGSSLRRGRGR